VKDGRKRKEAAMKTLLRRSEPPHIKRESPGDIPRTKGPVRSQGERGRTKRNLFRVQGKGPVAREERKGGNREQFHIHYREQ